MKKGCILFIWSFLLSAALKGQSYYFKSYQVASGISSNTITCMLQDQKGFMWFGTRNGLNRFDGYGFRVFRNNLQDPHSLGSNSILSLYEDAGENLWIGTYKGVFIYDPLKERFAAFPQLGQSEIRAIRGHNSFVWIISDNKLFRWNLTTKKLDTYTFANGSVSNIAISPEGVLWVATNSGIIKKYNADKNTFTDLNISALYSNAYNTIQDIYPVSDSTILVGSMFNTLLLNFKSGKSTDLFKLCKIKVDVHVHKILQHTPSEYWIGAETGLYIIDLKTQKAKFLQKERDNPYALTDNVIYTLYKDREESIWLGTFSGGINFFSRQTNQFQKYFPHKASNNLSGSLVHEICSDQYGKIWIGTEDAGLNKLDPKTGSIQHFMQGGENGLSYNNIHGLLAYENELWIGTYEHGLDVMDLRTEKVVRHFDAGNKPGQLKSNFIVSLYKTQKNQILVGTWNGLFWYNRKEKNFTADTFFTMQIQGIHEDEEGTIWVASYGKGVYFANVEKGLSGRLQFQSTNTNSLPNNYVNSICEDRRGNLLICSESGLTKYNKATKTFIRYSTNEGLPDNQVFRIVEDADKSLWVSTARGMAHFDSTFKKIKTYTTYDGLISNQFNYNSSYISPEGTIYFGTSAGMISFQPSKFYKSAFIAPVVITGIQVNNKDLEIKERSALQQSINHTSTLKLSHDSAALSFEVAALSYITPELNAYAYKMEGYDKDWTTFSSQRKIYYTRLPPGDYTFKVKGAGASEVWNMEEKKLSIQITPPFWGSLWAYLLYGIIIILIIYTIIKYYHLAQTESNKRKFELFEREKEREVYNSKIDFFTNIAHEIRTPLTLIKLPFEKLMLKINDPEIKESLQTMKKNINRLVDLTNQLLDFRKAEANKLSLTFTKTDINDAIREVFEAFRPYAEGKDINYTMDLPRVSLQAYVDGEAFQKIMSNLLSNALKYASKNVVIRLLPFSSEDTYFNIEVKNDGYQIPDELKQKIFEPFYRLKETEKLEGTGIGLPLSRALAGLHSGTLDLKQSEESLNIFVLSLPIHQDTGINFINKEVPDTSLENIQPVAESRRSEKPILLLVEDNKEIIDFIGKELKSTYHIFKAGHGVEALDILQTENIQVIISDIMMPVMNGLDLCKKVKSDLQYSHIPFVLLTAKNTLNSKIEGLEVGADAYIEKPFSMEHLQAQISNLIHNRQIVKEYFARSPLTHLKGIACSRADKQFLEHLNKVIENQITDMDLDVDQLSRLMNMSRPTLYRKIKALSNLTPNELINLSRLKKAAELLANGEYKINEVAHLVGYSVQGNFSRDFHKQFGVTPSAYIQSLEEQK